MQNWLWIACGNSASKFDQIRSESTSHLFEWEIRGVVHIVKFATQKQRSVTSLMRIPCQIAKTRISDYLHQNRVF